MADDGGSHRLQITLTDAQYDRLLREFDEGTSDAERARMAIEIGIRTRESYISKREFRESMDEVVCRLDAIYGELAEEE